jgi:hypothetical protein
MTHTCIKDDGGTPNRKCHACEDEKKSKFTPFITTFTGRKVNPLDLRPEDIDIRDIAHHLSCTNRFVGALQEPISIAQHSVYVSRLLKGTGWEREGLFHDAAEAYLGDVSKWVKQTETMKAYREAELQAWYSICTALGLRVDGDPDCNPMVRKADDLMVRFEALQGSGDPSHLFALESHPEPNEEEISRVSACEEFWCSWSWYRSKEKFLLEAGDLGFDV